LANRLYERNTLVNQAHDDIRVFIISSVETLPIASALQESFAHDPFLVKSWPDGVFRASSYAIESLTAELDRSDFAIAIAQPDDLTQKRGETFMTPRDNVLFELGMFIGRLGRHRTFLMEPARSDVKLPSDLTGITTVPYKTGDPKDLLALIAPAVSQIRRAILDVGPNN
jgi:predicted nucleotide-binding protein